ncbi:MAG: hypothetical protein ACPIA7_05470 [Akkermansiaceae bacterium]
MFVTESELASLLKLSLPALQRLRRLYPDKLDPLKLGRKRWYDFHEVTHSMREIKKRKSPE